MFLALNVAKVKQIASNGGPEADNRNNCNRIMISSASEMLNLWAGGRLDPEAPKTPHARSASVRPWTSRLLSPTTMDLWRLELWTCGVARAHQPLPEDPATALEFYLGPIGTESPALW